MTFSWAPFRALLSLCCNSLGHLTVLEVMCLQALYDFRPHTLAVKIIIHETTIKLVGCVQLLIHEATDTRSHMQADIDHLRSEMEVGPCSHPLWVSSTHIFYFRP